jgi:hypothetical protein
VSLTGQTPTLPSVSSERGFSRLDGYSLVTVYARIRRAEYSEKRLMPKVREWMNANSWLVNIIACVVFIVLILFG